MSSRERLLAAIDGEAGAPAACSFMMFRVLREQCRDEYDFALRQAELGLDARLRLDDLPVRFGSQVTVREWVEDDAAGGAPRLTRVYETPAGPLTSSLRLAEGWPYGHRLPLFGDHLTPRAIHPPLSTPQDLEALRHVLAPPADDDVRAFLAEGAARQAFADSHGLLLCGGYRGERKAAGEDRGLVGENFCTVSVIDTLMWLCGGTEPLIWGYEQPEFLEAVITFLEEWNRARLAIHLEAGAEVVFRRAWYEGTDFWSPSFYRRFILPCVRRDVELAHQAGARYAYIITSGMAAVAELILEAGVDVIVGIDPGQGKGTSLREVAEQLGGRVGLWGGVNGPLVVEQGTEQQVREAVEEALAVLGTRGRFILSPVDNLRADTEQCWHNLRVFIDTWRANAGGGV